MTEEIRADENKKVEVARPRPKVSPRSLRPHDWRIVDQGLYGIYFNIITPHFRATEEYANIDEGYVDIPIIGDVGGVYDTNPSFSRPSKRTMRRKTFNRKKKGGGKK